MIKNVAFDCWSTLIRFKAKRDDWHYYPLIDHLINKDDVNKEEIDKFISSFFKSYYNTDYIFEIDNIALLNLIKDTFKLKLDEEINVLSDEVLNYLDNKEEENINEFLQQLNKKNINTAAISNTIYSNKKTREIINTFIKNDFKDIITSNEYGVRKPSPLFFNAALNKLNFKKEETIYIGDSPIEDVYGPYLSSMKGAILVLNSKKDPSVLKDKVKGSNFKYLVFNNYKEVISKFNDILDYFS